MALCDNLKESANKYRAGLRKPKKKKKKVKNSNKSEKLKKNL